MNCQNNGLKKNFAGKHKQSINVFMKATNAHIRWSNS